MSDKLKRTPEQIVKDLRDMDKQILDPPGPTIFGQAADLIEDLQKKPPVKKDTLITNE